MNSISILFSGRGSNAHNIIDNIIQKKLKFNIKNIICNNKNSPAIETFSKKNIFVDVLNSNDYRNNENFNNDLLKKLDPQNGDLLLLCGFMKKIPANIIKSYNGNVINIHPSILPKYKGLDTHSKVIKNGDSFHGCTTHFVTEDIDCGPIIAQYIIKVNSDDNEKSIADRLLIFEHKLYYNTLELIQCNILKYQDKKIYHNDKILVKPIIYND